MPINIGSGTGNVTYSNGNFYDSAGNIISGVASYTWAQFTAGDFDTSIARYVHVSDRHSTTDGTSTPGSLWRIDPSATSARKRNLMSGPIYFATLDAAPDPASWPNLKIFAANIGMSGAELVSNATVYRLIQPYVTLVNNLSLLSRAKGSSPDITTEWQPLPVRLYRDINNKSIMQNGDYLVIHNAWAEKTGTTDTLSVQIRFGTGNAITDTSMLAGVATGTSAQIERIIRFMEIGRVDNVTVRHRGLQSTVFQVGPLTTARGSDITVPNMDSTSDSYLNIGMYNSGLTDTALGLREYEVRLVKGY